MFHIGIVESIHQNAIKIIENNDNYSFEIIQDIEENNLMEKNPCCNFARNMQYYKRQLVTEQET